MKNSYGYLLALPLFLLVFSCSENTEPPTGSDNDLSEEEITLEITSIQPDEGSAGTNVTVSGSGFSETPSENKVTFGGAEGTVEEASGTSLKVVVPEEAETGTVEITVGNETKAGPTFTVVEETEPEQQTYKVEGMVVNEATGAGIEGVEISFSNDLDPVFTSADGSWSAEGLEGPVAVTAESNQWDFAIHTRLVLGEENDIIFEAYSDLTPPENRTWVAYQYREGCSQGTACDKPFSIWVMRPNGLEKEQLTDEEGSDFAPVWSPDGEKIAFASDRDSESGAIRIWIMNKDGSDMADTGVEGWEPAWSPNGDQIAYVQNGNIWLMDLDGNTQEIFASPDFAGSPEWSPDGSKIAFDLREDASTTHIWAMEADGSNITQLTTDEAPNRSPAWEPSGESILFTSRRSAVDRLRLMDVDGSNDRTRDWPDHAQTQPVWSPDGKEILYVYRRMIPISDRIHWVPADNDAWMTVAPDSDAESEFWANSPAWSPR